MLFSGEKHDPRRNFPSAGRNYLQHPPIFPYWKGKNYVQNLPVGVFANLVAVKVYPARITIASLAVCCAVVTVLWRLRHPLPYADHVQDGRTLCSSCLL